MEIKGIVTAIPTGFNEEGKVCFDAFKRHIDHSIEAGVDGFWLCGATGIGLYLTEEERKRIVEFSVEHVAGRVPLWVHVGSMIPDEALRLAEHAGGMKVAGISSLPPLFHTMDLDKTASHLIRVQKASGLPITYYHLPPLTHLNFSAMQLVELSRRVPHMQAIKFSELDMFKAVTVKQHAPAIKIMSGCEHTLLGGFALGCFDGTVGGLQNMMPGPLADIYRLFLAKEYDRARKIQLQIARVAQIQWAFDPVASTYGMLKLLGFDYGRPRPPMSYLENSDMEKIRTELRKIVNESPFSEKRTIRTDDFIEL